MAKRDYDKDIRRLQKELRKRIKQHKKRTDLQELIAKTKLLKKRALKKIVKKVVKKKPKPIKKVPVSKKKIKYVAPPPPPRKKKVVKKKPAKKKVVVKKKPVRKAEKKKKRKWYEPKPVVPKAKVYFRETGDERGFSEDDYEVPDDVNYFSSRSSRSTPNEMNLSETFRKMFIGHLRPTFEADDVSIYRHGVVVRVNSGEINQTAIDKIAESLAEIPNSSMHVIDEKSGFSVRLNFGDPENPDSFRSIIDSFKELAPIVRRTYDIFYDMYGEDLDWFDYWECDTMGPSGEM